MIEPRAHLWTDLAAAFAIGAGLVHAAAAGTHTGDTTLVWLFALTAVAQGAAGAAILASASRRHLLVGGAVNLAAVAAWASSRTFGLPMIDSLAGREAVGPQDLAAAALAAAAVLATIVALRTATATASRPRVLWVPAFAIVAAVSGMAAPHTHDERHDHDHRTGVAAEDDRDHTDEHAHGDDGLSVLAADPIFAGADTSHATDAQLDAAKELIDTTRAALDPSVTGTAVTSTADAEAAGYVWIGDGRRVGGFQHYVNPRLLADGRVLDAEHIEALVFENTSEGPVLMSAMYLVEPGSTMADVPDVAGDLTTWHDHQNLCWDETGTRLAGVSTDGVTCRPGGELRATAPMLHVWLSDRECGPFAGIEGHGSADCSAHDH